MAARVSAPQPRLAIVLASLAVPYVPGLVAYGLRCWPRFWTFTANHNGAYYVGLLIAQMALALGVVVVLSMRYRSALWSDECLGCRQVVVALIILLPLLLFHLFHCLTQVHYIISLRPADAQGVQRLASFYQYEWDAVAAGTSPAAIACASIRTLAGPLLEEVVLTGLLMNAIARRYGIAAAVLVVPVCFTFGHVLNVGINGTLIVLFFAGITYAMVRVCSGSLLLAVLGHSMINAVIFIPKWLVAALYLARV